MNRFISTLAAVAVLSGSAFLPAAQAVKPTAAKAGAKKTAALVCPVTGEKIASKKAASHSAYKGKTYYFCCAGCKPKFDKAPKKYVENAVKGKYEKM